MSLRTCEQLCVRGDRVPSSMMDQWQQSFRHHPPFGKRMTRVILEFPLSHIHMEAQKHKNVYVYKLSQCTDIFFFPPHHILDP